MLEITGRFFIGISLVGNFCTLVFGVVSLLKGDPRWEKWSRIGLYVSSGGLFAALMLLLAAFLTDQFQLLYVAQHSNLSLPLHLKITAIWAGQEGSLLLWAFLQALLGLLVAGRGRTLEPKLRKWTVLLLAFVAFFFCVMTYFFSNPFVTLDQIPSDGLGMNPLLRHPGMIFHPPVLFIGYVGLAAPFAYALGALFAGDVDLWPKEVRSWLLISWITLGLGIFLGARWAYDVLGWGGYWGWDPVENAALMPWLTATALLHGLVMQERGKGFKVWNVSLAVLSFAFVIFGTFATRSGVIESVHAFSRSQYGPYFLAMIGLILVGSLVIMIIKRQAFGELVYPEKIISREGAFFFTLLLLMLITLSILAGTLLPTLTDGRFAAPPAWFNRVVGPQLGALVLLMGICPLLGRLFASLRSSLYRGLPPLLGLLTVPALAFSSGFDHIIALVGFGIAGLAGGAAIGEILFDIASRVRRKGFKEGIVQMPVAGSHGYGGPLVHFGVVLMAIGVIGTQMFSFEKNISLIPGDSVDIHEYVLVYDALHQEAGPDHQDTWAEISVYRDAKRLAVLEPTLSYYPVYQQTMATPAVRSGLGEDLYLVMFQWGANDAISLMIEINPLSLYLWVGGLILLIGGLLAWWPKSTGGDDKEGRKRKAVGQIVALGVVVLFIIFAVSMWGSSTARRNQERRPMPGNAAPAFAAADVTGAVFSLAEQDGKILVINFWATWCPQCEEELQEFQSVWLDYQSQKVQFVGVAMNDSVGAVLAMADELGITYPLIVETEGVITSAYGVTAAPETFIVDAEGNIAFVYIGVVEEALLREELNVLLDRE